MKMRMSLVAWAFEVMMMMMVMGSAMGEEGCLMTDTECQCTLTTPAGTCMRNQGSGMCVLGMCDAGHRCDCMGYEKCSRKQCGKYVAVGESSETEAFECRMDAEGGSCMAFVELIDTVVAVGNAEIEAAANNDEATYDEGTMIRMMDEVGVEKKTVNQNLREVERMADQIPVADLEAIEAEALVVMESMKKVGVLTVDVVDDADAIATMTQDVRRCKRKARDAQKLADEKDGEVKAEKAKREQDKDLLKRLEGEKKEREDDRRKKVLKGADVAKGIRERKKGLKGKYAKAVQERDLARKASSNCVKMCGAALQNARNVPRGKGNRGSTRGA